MTVLAYDVNEAAVQANVSKDLIRRGIASTNPRAFPPPLKAKKVGQASNARIIILATDLAAWLANFPDA
jgi:hypothetical protein